MSDIHPTAIVAPGATIGARARIGPWCQIGPEVSIGDDAVLFSHVVVDGHTRIGAGARLYPFCTVGLAPQDLKYKGEPTRCEVGARTVVREHVTIHRGTATGSGITRVGADCLLMAVVHVAHDCTLGDGVIVANNVVMGGHVEIGDRAVIGGAAALHQFVRIGGGAMIGGVSGVEADVIPFGSVIGNRARLKGLNLVQLKRRGYDRTRINALRAAFRALFGNGNGNGNGGVFAERLRSVRCQYGSEPLVAEMLEFVEAPSKRGLIRAVLGAETPDDDAWTDRPALGILAGGGNLPGRVAAAAQAAGRIVFIVGLEGHAEPEVIAPYPHATVQLGAAGRILALLRERNCRDLVLIGPVRRPSILDIRPDVEGTRLLARVGRAAFGGDDGLLAAIHRVLGEEGFRVLGAHRILTEAVGASGLLGSVTSDAQAQADIERGRAVLHALGSVDVGQACVVQQGIVLAVEAVEGTDAMLARAAGLARPGPGGVLVKLVKPGQDRRTDLPTIGPRTIHAAAEAGLRGVAFEAGGTILAEREAAIAAADRMGLFLLGVDP